MKKHLYYYPNHTAFLSSTDLKNIHNVVYCDNEAHLHYDHHDYSQDYLTTKALENGTISFTILDFMGTDYITSISYSTNNGETWNTTTNLNNKENDISINVNVNTGDKVLWKGIASLLGEFDDRDGYEYVGGSHFSSTCTFDVSGNIQSMIYGDNFSNISSITNNYIFACLFSDYKWQTSAKVVNTKNLILPTGTSNYCYQNMFQGCTDLISAPELPATTLSEYCYTGMFRNCTSLVTAPILPATILNTYCYNDMFWGCTNLRITPTLPATTLAKGCYSQMFRDCTSLTAAPELPVTTLSDHCYATMFKGCTNLISTPELPATVLTDHCYTSMFQNCTSLTTAPNLPATTLTESCYNSMFEGCTNLRVPPSLPVTILADYCYGYMFKDCTSLIVAPELPARILKLGCYYGMFWGCTSLTTSPRLPGKTLLSYCYSNMFNGCTNLSSITCLATDISATGCILNWVNSVPSEGTFIKAETMNSWPINIVSGVPYHWLVIDDFQEATLYIYTRGFSLAEEQDYLELHQDFLERITSNPLNGNRYVYTNNTIQMNGNTYYIWEYSLDTSASYSYLLTTTANINTLYNQSLNSNLSNQFTAFAGRFSSDFDEVYTEDEITGKIYLLNATTENGTSVIYIDDFADTLKEFAVGKVFSNEDNSLYYFKGDTITYDGNTYYLWEKWDENYSNDPYFVTTTIDFNTLYNQSLKNNINNRFTSAVGTFNNLELIYQEQEILQDGTDRYYLINIGRP